MGDEADDNELDGGETITVELVPGLEAERLDKVLAQRVPDLSRARLQALIAAGALTRDGGAPSAKALPGLYSLRVPALLSDSVQPEAIPLAVLFEDDHLIVVDKPAGMAAHPAPGTPGGTLVNALLHHCAGRLSGVGGVARPGIVHRLDKDTSGVMVAAKSDAAHAGLSALFAEHDLERSYVALCRGVLHPARGSIVSRIGRSHHDRKKMAVLRSGGREAITHYAVERAYGSHERPQASRIACRLETGRTHQIRVHLSSKGSPVLGDPVYGSGVPSGAVRQAIVAAGLNRQALHAAVLGFRHPVSGEQMRFETPPPPDMARLQSLLEALDTGL